MTDAPRDHPRQEEPPASGALPAAVTWHAGAPSGDHFDVLLASRMPIGPEDEACACWRASADPGAALPGTRIAVERIHAHRAVYLWLDGPHPLDAGRGTVTPVRRGSWTADGHGGIEFRWTDGTATRVAAESDTSWRIDG